MQSEEEKKAIGEMDISKTIESNINYWRNKCFEQQKEIEELNDFIKENPPVIPFIPEDFKKDDDFADLVTLKNKEYISKDKIRKKIKELEEIGQMLTAEQGYWGSPKLLNQMEILKELLGGENE